MGERFVAGLPGEIVQSHLRAVDFAAAYARLERYGFVLVIILLVTGILGDLMEPLLRFGTYAVDSITGL